MMSDQQLYGKGSQNLMQVCIASSLMNSRMLLNSLNFGTQYTLLPGQRVYEQLWCHARPALSASTIYPEQAGSLRKSQSS